MNLLELSKDEILTPYDVFLDKNDFTATQLGLNLANKMAC